MIWASSSLDSSEILILRFFLATHTHLAEESDLGFDGGSHLRVELVEVDRSLVRQMVKDVERLGRSIKVRMGCEIGR